MSIFRRSKRDGILRRIDEPVYKNPFYVHQDFGGKTEVDDSLERDNSNTLSPQTSPDTYVHQMQGGSGDSNSDTTELPLFKAPLASYPYLFDYLGIGSVDVETIKRIYGLQK